MQRDQQIQNLASVPEWDIIIIGGGATGLGAAVDAASRGYKTLLVEQHDFAKGTSSRSTKLVHGGVRYLQQGNIKLVMEALRERGLLLRNAPHLVHNQSFIIPNYKWWEGPFYGLGLKLYDVMAGKLGFGATQWLSKEETLHHIPTLDPEGLHGGVLYHDGQFDDARLALNLAQTAVEQGATLINYCGVTGLIKSNGRVTGVQLTDTLNQQQYTCHSRVVINATGVFTDNILQMDDPAAKPIIAPSQGIHLVFDAHFLPSANAIMVPHTDDGRVLFAVPWHGKVIVGTTDTPINHPVTEPKAMEEEIHFILKHIARYLTKDPTREDVKTVFAGLRPLVKQGDTKNTAAISRDHTILVAASGLISITGGKWTTYRKMAEDVINQAIEKGGLPARDCITRTLRLHGWCEANSTTERLQYYGSDAPAILAIEKENSAWAALLHPALPYSKATIIHAVRHEMCMTVEDALSRRTRALLLDARAALEAAPAVARLMAEEKGYSAEWENSQLEVFRELAGGYVL
jgi:glycerol-3-phosphate dehydrogenase